MSTQRKKEEPSTIDLLARHLLRVEEKVDKNHSEVLVLIGEVREEARKNRDEARRNHEEARKNHAEVMGMLRNRVAHERRIERLEHAVFGMK